MAGIKKILLSRFINWISTDFGGRNKSQILEPPTCSGCWQFNVFNLWNIGWVSENRRLRRFEAIAIDSGGLNPRDGNFLINNF